MSRFFSVLWVFLVGVRPSVGFPVRRLSGFLVLSLFSSSAVRACADFEEALRRGGAKYGGFAPTTATTRLRPLCGRRPHEATL